MGAAHGSPWYENRLDLTKPGVTDVSLPPTLLVEEGKHAVTPDRNADGWYTPGYDVNDRPNNAWGVRDAVGSGYVWGSAYRAQMTKPRHGKNRIMVDLEGRREALWANSYRSAWWALPSKTYRLRKLPEACAVYQDNEPPEERGRCATQTVRHFLQEKGIQSRSGGGLIMYGIRRVLGEFGLWFIPGTHVMGKAFGLRIMHALLPIGPGWVTSEWTFHRGLVEEEDNTRTVADSNGMYFRPSLDIGFYYKPSMSRAVEWYGGFGFGPGLGELTEEELVAIRDDSWRSDGGSESTGPRGKPGYVTETFAEVGLEFRWQSRFTISPGLRYYGVRGFSPVFKLGIGGARAPD